MGKLNLAVAALGAALVIAGCGGGDTRRSAISSVRVVGDSLSDSGTFAGVPGFGRIFSVQGPTAQNWVERTAADFGVSGLCEAYKFTGTAFVANPIAGCTNYAIGGGRINNPASAGGVASPVSIVKQLQDAGATYSYSAKDLLLVDGGGNDAADLIGAYLSAGKDGGASYAALLSTVLSPAVVAANLATGPSGLAAAGGLYMAALADKLYDAIKANALDKGAVNVIVANMPAITSTPRFQMLLGAIAVAYGEGGNAASTQMEALFKSWLQAFNAQLSARAAGNLSVVVLDLYGTMSDWVANPAKYGLTNVATPACPPAGVGSDGLPSYNFQTCTGDALSALSPPAGSTGAANWWKTYLFSDNFHPTPYGYQLANELVARMLAQAGWI